MAMAIITPTSGIANGRTKHHHRFAIIFVLAMLIREFASSLVDSENTIVVFFGMQQISTAKISVHCASGVAKG